MLAAMQSPPGIQLITRDDLCVGCGACVHACPAETISMAENAATGLVEAAIADTAACANCPAPCLDVCPSHEEDFVELAGWTDPAQRIGPWHRIYTGHSLDESLRRRSSSGGVIRELCRHFLAGGEVDGVITLGHDQGLDYTPRVYRDIDALVAESPGSIYHSIGFEAALGILREQPGRFLLICTPCQLSSIRKWQRRFPDGLRGEIACTIGLICGWLYSRKSVEHFGRHMGVARGEIRDATYRGGDAIGSFTLVTDRARRAWWRRPQPGEHDHAAPYRVAFSRKYSCRRCLLCVEHLNYLADIVVGDAWLPRFEGDALGTSIVVVREPGRERALEALREGGRLHLEPATEEDVIASQGDYFAFGDDAQRVMNRLRRDGAGFVPSFTVQNPVRDLPSREVWRRNHVEPARQRAWIRAGLGYPRYRVQVLGWRLRACFWRTRFADALRRIKGRLRR